MEDHDLDPSDDGNDDVLKGGPWPPWSDLYALLAKGETPSQELVDQCKAIRSGLDETMLHWYALEGSPQVMIKIIELGFDVNVTNTFGSTPIMEVATMGRWHMVQVLFTYGARLDIKNDHGEDFFEALEERGGEIPEWFQKMIDGK